MNKNLLTALPVMLAGGIGALSAQNSQNAGNAPKKNVVYILTDQQSYYMISALAFGQSKYFSTPNLDKLVRSGYTFTNCCVANPVSVPSRFALMTGDSPTQYGVRQNFSPSKFEKDILAMTSQRAIGSLFKKAGYETWYGGKVHLPFANGKGGKNSIYNEPSQYGFDNYYTDDEREVLAGKSAEFFSEYKSKKPFLLVVSFINPHDICRAGVYMFNNKTPVDYDNNPATVTLDHYRQIMRAKNPAYYTGNEAASLPANFAATDHHPMNGTRFLKSFSDTDWKKYIWTYYQLVELVDSHIGQVLAALEKSPYKDNTVVIFTSDHGEMGGSHHMMGKSIFYDECLKVPMIFSGAGVQKGVIDRTTPVNNGWDLIPTMLDMVGIAKPSELHGISLYGLITKGTPVTEGRKYIYSEAVNGYSVIGDGRWQYSHYENMARFGLSDDPEVLFDLKTDPGEMHNLLKNKAYADKLTELRAALDKEMAMRGIEFGKVPVSNGPQNTESVYKKERGGMKNHGGGDDE